MLAITLDIRHRDLHHDLRCVGDEGLHGLELVQLPKALLPLSCCLRLGIQELDQLLMFLLVLGQTWGLRTQGTSVSLRVHAGCVWHVQYVSTVHRPFVGANFQVGKGIRKRWPSKANLNKGQEQGNISPCASNCWAAVSLALLKNVLCLYLHISVRKPNDPSHSKLAWAAA